MIQKVSDLIYKYFLFFLPQTTPFHPWDYVAHSIISFILAGSIFFFAYRVIHLDQRASVIAAVCITLTMGVIKELSDMRLGKTDIPQDIAADILGIVIALFLVFLFIRITN